MNHNEEIMNMYDLDRFLLAQKRDYKIALYEIQHGQKQGHWMWYIFPQIKGLGYSPTARYYALESIDEAKAYVANETLRDRLHEITEALLNIEENRSIECIMGYPDDMKLLSCMTLFELADPECDLYRSVIERYYSGKRDLKTLEILNSK